MEHDTFSQIYQTYVRQVFRFLLNLSGNYDIAEELTQETFVRAYQHLDDFRGDCQLYVWLCQIGKHLYFNHIKKERRFAPISEINHMASAANVEDDVVRKSTAEAIMNAVSKLSEPYQSVFLYRVFMQLSYREIGELFLKSDVWGRVTYYRAKKILQELLKEDNVYEL